MRKLITLSIALCSSLSLFAQQKNRMKHAIPEAFRSHRAFMMRQNPNVNAGKTTATEQRVIGESNYDQTGIIPQLTDSTKYVYTGQNGSKFDFSDMYFNGYYSSSVGPGSYPYFNEKMDVLADSIYYFYDINNNGALDLGQLYISQFTGTGNIADHRYYDTWNTSLDTGYRYIASYNGMGKLERLYALVYSDVTNQWDSMDRRDLKYNAQGQVTGDTTYYYDMGDWIPQQALVWSYDAAGNIDTIVGYMSQNGVSWAQGMKYVHTFYPNNTLKTSTMYLDSMGTGLQPFLKDTMGWNTAGTFTTYKRLEITNGVALEPVYSLSKHVNSAGLPDTVYYSEANAQGQLVMNEKYSYEYNSYDNPILSYTYAINGSGGSNMTDIYRYYYELYNTTGIKDVAAKADITTYPNPATDAVTLKWKEGKGQTVSLMLTNAAGQKVRFETFRWTSVEETVSLQGLTPGIYFITVADAKGNKVYSERVVKQ